MPRTRETAVIETELREFADEWFRAHSDPVNQPTAIPVGHPDGGPARLNLYRITHLKAPARQSELDDSEFSGRWWIDPRHEARYRVTIPIPNPLDTDGSVRFGSGEALVAAGAREVSFEVDLSPGPQEFFVRMPGKGHGVYFLDISLAGAEVAKPIDPEHEPNPVGANLNQPYREFTLSFDYRIKSADAVVELRDGVRVSLPPIEGWQSYEATIRGQQLLASIGGKKVEDLTLPESTPASGLIRFEPSDLETRNLSIRGFGRLEDLARWVDGLDFGFAAAQPFVRAQTGEVLRQDSRMIPETTHGRLLWESEDKNSCRLLTLDLNEVELTRRPEDPDGDETPAILWEKIDPREHGEEWLAKPWGYYTYQRRVRNGLNFHLYAVFLIHALRQAGEFDLAEQLLAKTRNHKPNNEAKRWRLDFDAFQQAVNDELSEIEKQRALAIYADPDVTPEGAIAKCQDVLRRFPNTEGAAECRVMIALLREVSKTHQPAKEAQSEELRIAALIIQLQDQNGIQWMSPGQCDPFNDPRREQSPAHQLVAIGNAAVPQLIEALSDQRVSRSRQLRGPYLSVGEIAKAVLERTAGRRFTYDAEIPKWWASIEGKTELEILTEATMSGRDDALHRAATLLDRYPEEGVPTIIQAAMKSDNKSARGQLCIILGRSESDAADAFLQTEMKAGPSLHTRIRAAFALKDPELTLPVMLTELEKLREAGLTKESDNDVSELFTFFLKNRSAEGVDRISENWDQMTPRSRRNIIDQLLDYSWISDFSAPMPQQGDQPHTGFPGSFWLSGFRVSANSQKPTPEFDAARDHLLVAILKDTSRISYSMSSMTTAIKSPRACDLAGYLLEKAHVKRFPDISFDHEVGWKSRELSRIGLIDRIAKKDENRLTKPVWPTEGREPGVINSVTVKLPEDGVPHLLAEEFEVVRGWEGQKLDVGLLEKLAERLIAGQPNGWEFLLRIESDPAVVPGADVVVEIRPFPEGGLPEVTSPKRVYLKHRSYRVETNEGKKTYHDSGTNESDPDLTEFRAQAKQAILDSGEEAPWALFLEIRTPTPN